MKIIINGEVVEVGGGSSEELYSTEEIRIGTWIDGKPLYRKVIEFTTPESGNGTAFTYDDNIQVVNLSGGIKKSDYSYRLFTLVGKDGMYANLTIEQGVATWDSNIVPYNNVRGIAILEYTKTTD